MRLGSVRGRMRLRGCGPAALSAITGLRTETLASAMRTRNGGRPQWGTPLHVLLSTAAGVGWQATPARVPPGASYASWLAQASSGLWLVLLGHPTGSHYVAVEVGADGPMMVDNFHRHPVPSFGYEDPAGEWSVFLALRMSRA